MSLAIEGKGYSSRSFDEVCFLEGLWIIDDCGMIEDFIESTSDQFHACRKSYLLEGKLKCLKSDEVLLPGFIDTHLHAPQWPQSGTALDAPLEVWLGKYTFPLEAKYKDLEFANEVYRSVVTETLKFGTTTALYFGTVDREPSVLLAKICADCGQRGLVGKVVMDDPQANPKICRDQSAKTSIEETEKFINEVLAIQKDCPQQVYPVITPRFIPSCSDEALIGLGQLVQKYPGIHVQSHVSESDWAHGFVFDRFQKNDAFALDDFGLLTNRTFLAHGNHLTEQDVDLLIQRHATIAHSPLSNAYFANAVLPVKEFVEKGLNISLATDISGGYTPSMYQAIRQAVISSRMLDEGVDPHLAKSQRGRGHSRLTLNNAFYLATVAGGIGLGLPLGKLEKGYCFDAQVVKIQSNIPHFYPELSPMDLFDKIILLSESVNICEVWVQGRQVK